MSMRTRRSADARACLLALALVGCGGEAPAPTVPTRAAAPTIEPASIEALPTTEPATEPAVPFADVRARSRCAFESIELLCAGLREHFGSSDGAWTSEDCALGPTRSSTGPLAEARLVGIHAGSGLTAGAPTTVRTLFGATLRGPAAEDVTTHVLLVARVGHAWFPLHLFDPLVRATDVEPDRFTWHLDDDGAALEWTDEPSAARREDPYGDGRVERTIVVTDHGVPVIAAQATTEIWRSDVDLACSRACHAEPTPPADPGCARRCASRAHGTRSWERVGSEIHIGATRIERTGASAEALELESRAAEIVSLAAASPEMLFCAFLPVEHAVARSVARSDPASVALLERARALLAHGGGRRVHGALAIADPDAPRSIVAIDTTLGTACGGGGCTTAIVHRTLAGPFPEEGVHHFTFDRAARVGCDDAALPSGPMPTLLEVAPAVSRDTIACGFGGWDGTSERTWVILRVLE